MTGQRGPGSPSEDDMMWGSAVRGARMLGLPLAHPSGGPAEHTAGVYPSGMKGFSSEQAAGRCEGLGEHVHISCLLPVAVPSSDRRQIQGHGGARSPARPCTRDNQDPRWLSTWFIYVASCVRLVITDAPLLSSLGGTRRDTDAMLGAEGEALGTRDGRRPAQGSSESAGPEPDAGPPSQEHRRGVPGMWGGPADAAAPRSFPGGPDWASRTYPSPRARASRPDALRALLWPEARTVGTRKRGNRG